MATLQTTTASNWPAIASAAVAEVEAIIDEYAFVGNWEDLTIAVRESEDDDPCLALYGYAAFEASKPILDDNDDPIDREHGYTEEFLERLAPHLEDPLVVETIGHEKCRFPLIGVQWTAWPDGTVQYDSFDHQPDKPATADESEPLTVTITAETVRIETAADREVAMWTREELAESPEAFSAAFEAVRQAADAPSELLEHQRVHLDAQSRDDSSEQ